MPDLHKKTRESVSSHFKHQRMFNVWTYTHKLLSGQTKLHKATIDRTL